MIFHLLQRRCTAALTAAAALAGCCLASSVWAASSTITLAGQSDQGAYQGFYLNLENSAGGDAPLTSQTLKLTLAIGDGKKWTYLTATPAWTYGHRYTVQAVIGPAASTLALDGQVVANASAQVSPINTDFIASYAADWANPETDYWAVEDSVTATCVELPTLTKQFTLSPSDVAALFFSARQPIREPEFHYDGRRPLTIDVTFTLVQRPPSVVPYAPLVDQFGQAVHGVWPDKVLSDRQLIASVAQERQRLAAMPADPGVDHYGGITKAGWRETPTGFYRVERRHGYYWLITPTGYPCFYTSICNAPLITGNGTPISGREGLFAKLPPQTPKYAAAYGTDLFADGNGTRYTVFDTANMITKYGSNWRAVSSDLAQKRLKAWGFTGVGKWSQPVSSLPYLVVLNHTGVPSPYGKPDIFDLDVRAALTSTLKQQIQPHINDPYLVGWSLGNEYDEIVNHTTIAGFLADAHSSPGKKALIDYAVQTLYGGSLSRLAAAWNVAVPVAAQDALYTQPLTAPAADLESLRRFFADKYYQCIYETVKSIDPHHLYLGFWIVPYWWENESDWGLIARHCDVIGYDYYADHFADDNLRRLMQQADKPVLCGEFGNPPDYASKRGFGLYRSWTHDDADAAKHYEQWMHDASLSPYCIGGSWFEYRDEPITGRGPGHGPDPLYGEDYAFGVVDVTDRPKWELVSGMRTANRLAAKTRLGATAALTSSTHP